MIGEMQMCLSNFIFNIDIQLLKNIFMELKKTNIYVTGKRPTIENVSFGSSLTVTTEVTDTEENKAHTWYKLTGASGTTRASKISFTTTQDNVNISFKIKSSSESGYDYVYLTKLDAVSTEYDNSGYKASGDGTEKVADYTVQKAGDHFIYIGYTKDSSTDGYNDCGYVCLLTKIDIQVTEIKSVYVENSKIQQMNINGKNLFEYGKGNTISWTNMRKPYFGNSYTSYNGAIGISYSYTNTKTNRTFTGIAYSYDTSFLKNMLENTYNNIDYIKFNGKYNTYFNKTEYYEQSYTKTIDLSDIDFSRINNINGMFYGWQPLSEVILPEDFCKNKTDLSNLFGGTGNLTYAYESLNSISSLNTTGWDTSKVTNMAGMFTGCGYLTNIDVSGWDTSKVTNMHKMFGCNLSVLDQPLINMSFTNIDVSGWDTSKVTNMAGMFTGCGKLTTLDVSKWDVSKVNNMSNMFNGCKKLITLDVSNWNVSNVTNMRYMFYQCSGLTTLDVSNWDVSNVKDMYSMFDFCGHITKFDVSKWDVSNVTNIGFIFTGCGSLTTLDLSNWNVNNVTSNYNPFNYCKELTTLIDGHESDQNVSILNGLKNDISLKDSTKLNYESVYALFRGVATVTTKKTITLPKVMEGNLDSAKVKIATDKGWTVA